MTDIASFVKNLFDPKASKLILPTIMSLILISGAFSVMYESENNEELIELSIDGNTELNKLFLERKYFNDSVDKNIDERRDNISKEYGDRRDEIRSQPLFMTRSALANVVFNTELFPLTPEVSTPPFQDQKLAEALAVLFYSNEQFEELHTQINTSENYTHQDFLQEVDKIKEVNWEDPEIQEFIENSSKEDLDNSSIGKSGEITAEDMKSYDSLDLGLLDLALSLLITFGVYYLLSSVIIEGFKKIRNRTLIRF